MSLSAYSYLIGREVTLLNDEEWKVLEPFYFNKIERVRKYREIHGCGLKEAIDKEDIGKIVIGKYKEMTGVQLTHPDQVLAVRMSNYGSLCPDCNHPFRSAKATMCASCGFNLPDGKLAGPLLD